jgi:hypothetical protein
MGRGTQPGVRSRLIAALAVGVAFAFMSWVMLGDHSNFMSIGARLEWLSPMVMILLLPGLLGGAMVGGNFDLFDPLASALGNFVFYFGLVYLGLTIRAKRKGDRLRASGNPDGD